MKKLYFCRHGQTEMNTLGHFSGTTETPLTTEGRKQAKRAGKKAKDLNIDYIISSPLSRAVETAQIIAKEIGYPIDKIHTNELFIERHFGDLEGRAWNPDLDMDGIADIETRDTVLERARLALEFLETIDADNILVVSHGSFGRALRSLFLPHIPYHQTSGGRRHLAIPNAEIINWL